MHFNSIQELWENNLVVFRKLKVTYEGINYPKMILSN